MRHRGASRSFDWTVLALSAAAALGACTVAAAASGAPGFVENRGQLDGEVRYYALGQRGGVFFTDHGPVLEVREVLPAEEREFADCPVDRLSLLRASDPPEHPDLHLYSLTPDTSIPMRKRHRRDGRKEERALIHALVKQVWPAHFPLTCGRLRLHPPPCLMLLHKPRKQIWMRVKFYIVLCN